MKSPAPEKEQAKATADPGRGAPKELIDWLLAETGQSEAAVRQMADYFTATYKALGVIPSQKKLVIERFFDESGGMQLVIHSPFGIRVNRAWGLALRKRFCRSFNFELQAAATDDAIVLSLGTQHSFPLEEVFHYLNSKTVRELLVQALLDAPMFPIRWRWNASRALALPRQRGGRKIPAPLQRMEAENLLAAVFPDQLACLENIVGDREVPDHPLVKQTIDDCLTEAMDIDGLIEVLKKIESGAIECVARDLPKPSPMAHEILNARPYAFLDNAPLEERRTQAVYTRRASESAAEGGLGILDAAAIQKVCAEAWPRAVNPDELHEALLSTGLLAEDELVSFGNEARAWLEVLASQNRAGRLDSPTLQRPFWIAAERLPFVQAIYQDSRAEPRLRAPDSALKTKWERADAIREMVRGRMEINGPVTSRSLAEFFRLTPSNIDTALFALEAEGFILRGKFHPGASELEWCDRRLLARIHRLTINRLRAEIQPVSLGEFQRFLMVWQRADPEHRLDGLEGVAAVLELFDGYELAAAAWEPQVLSLRINNYTTQWLDQLCFTGRIGWGRLSQRQSQNSRPSAPVRSSPVALFNRQNLHEWLALNATPLYAGFAPDTMLVLDALTRNGAMFFSELVKRTGLLASRVESALAELAAQGWVTSDSFEGLRALLAPQDKRAPFGDMDRQRRHRAITSVEYGGRWSLFRQADLVEQASRRDRSVPPFSELTTIKSGKLEDESQTRMSAEPTQEQRDAAIEAFARVLLRRYGVVFRRMLDRESFNVSWYELGRVYRRLEARGEIRGGYFVNGVSGEQFALPEAIGSLRSIRRTAPKGTLVAVSGADPLNLAGILTPGPRVTSVASNRLLLRDGVPIAALEAGQVVHLEQGISEPEELVERALRVGKMPVALRPYYAMA